MTLPDRPNVATLPKGYEVPLATFRVSSDGVSDYLEAVQDDSGAYGGFAPPLAVVALALRALLERLDLPDGSLHTAQEMECRAGVPVGSELGMRAQVVQRSERGGFVATAIEFEVTPDGASEPAIVGRTTVMAPQSEEA